MKKVLFLFLLCFGLVAHANTIRQIIFFGDSLTDNGNFYKKLFKLAPKSPPYFNGRFSNGPTWAEYVETYYLEKYAIPSEIYAVGGASALFHPPSIEYASTSTLPSEVDDYLLHWRGLDKSTTLFVIWIGGNDYVFDHISNPDILTGSVIDRISGEIKRLIVAGGKNFLIFNLPDLSKIPYLKNGSQENKDREYEFSKLHNEKLIAAINHLKQQAPAIHFMLMDISPFFEEAVTHIYKFNKIYHLNLQNITDGCWPGWFIFSSEEKTENQPEQDFLKSTQLNENEINAETNTLLHSPLFRITNAVDKAYEAGMVPCQNPDSYLFWDILHPTAIIHQLISTIVIKKLEKELPITTASSR